MDGESDGKGEGNPGIDGVNVLSEIDPLTPSEVQRFKILPKEEQKFLVYAALSKLLAANEGLGEVVIASCMDDRPYKEISQEFGVQKPAISKRRQKGLWFLRKYLQELLAVHVSEPAIAPPTGTTTPSTEAARSP